MRAPSASSKAQSEPRQPVLETARALLAEGRTDAVLSLVGQLLARNTELEKKLARVKPSERVSSQQLLLLIDELQAAAAADADAERQSADTQLQQASGIDQKRDPPPPVKPLREPSVRKPLPDHLPRIPNEIPVPADQRACPKCGAERTCIGCDVTEVLELVPAHLVVRQDKREKLACLPCEGELARAPRGDTVVEGGRLGPALVAQLLVDKYRDGLPLHRQKERFEKMGWEASVSTLSDQVTWATDLLRPLWVAAQAVVVAAEVMHLDGTGLPVLDRDSPKGIKLGALWGYVGNDNGKKTALYHYLSTGKKLGQRPGELGPEDMLKLRVGYTVADASGHFEASFKREGLVECGCNMHARRYFVKALDGGDTRAALPLAAFKKLYEIEAELRDKDTESRRTVRQQLSRPVYDELSNWCRVHQPHEPPKSPLGRAISYLRNNEEALTRFLEDGLIPIDNGEVERLHVRVALTRKNYLFAGSDVGAERAAIAYTVLGSCALEEVDPVEYLKDVLPRLAKKIRLIDVAALLPAAWKAERAAKAAAEATPAVVEPAPDTK